MNNYKFVLECESYKVFNRVRQALIRQGIKHSSNKQDLLLLTEDFPRLRNNEGIVKKSIK